ncbi:MAG: hypothetical protein AAB611_02565, partial [Patescibacteria group bacterium]
MSPIVPEGYHITPSHIDTSKNFMGAFDKLGREVFACALVIYCQYKGYWISMDHVTIKDICGQLGANIYFFYWFLEQHLMARDRYNKFC